MTAFEVKLSQKLLDELAQEQVNTFHDKFVLRCSNAAYCYIMLGFYVPHNKSPKRLARLKHSLTLDILKPFSFNSTT